MPDATPATASAPPPAGPPPAAAPPATPPARRRVPRWVPATLLVLAALLVSAGFGVTTARTEGSLGPHEAQYAVTTDSTITIDLGPFGTLQIDSPLPLWLGARVTVEEIPVDVDALDNVDTLQALTGDLNSYLQFFTGPQATIEDAARALAVDALWRTGGALVVLVGGWFAVRALLGAARRREITARVAPHRGVIAAGTAVVVLVATAVTASEEEREREQARTQAASAVFDGTPLEGARITGRLGGIVDTYGGLVVQALHENEEFYDRADDNLVAAWGDWQDAQEADRRPGDDDATDPARSGAADATQDAGGAPAADGPADDATPSPSGDGDAEPLTLLLVSDLHCNVGMAPLITSMVELSGAQVVLDAGDTTMNGTSVEQYCVTTFARAIPSGVDLITAPGNHDSADTTAQYARAGATVLDGGVIDVHGLRLLGDHDPKATRLIVAQEQEESYREVGERLSTTACDDRDGVDLVMFHNPRVAPSLLADGCVPALVSGHMHTRTDPEQIERGIRYISSSTAGAQENEPRIGPLKGTAEMTLLRWDPDSRRILDWQLVEVGTDASVTVQDPAPWPAVEDEDDAAGTTPDADGAADPDAPAAP